MKKDEGQAVPYLHDLIGKYGKLGEKETLHDAACWFVACQMTEQLYDLSFKEMARFVLEGMEPVGDRDITQLVNDYLWNEDEEKDVEDGEASLIQAIRVFYGTE